MASTRTQLKRTVRNDDGNPYEFVQFADSYPGEYQWEFRVDRGDLLWTDAEKAPVEAVLMQYMHGGLNNYWSFLKVSWCQRVLVTRGNWLYNDWVEDTPEAIAAYVTRWYEEWNRLLQKDTRIHDDTN